MMSAAHTLLHIKHGHPKSSWGSCCSSAKECFLHIILQSAWQWRGMHTGRSALGVTLDLPGLIVERADGREADERRDVSSSHGASLIWAVVMYYTAFSIIVATCREHLLEFVVNCSMIPYNDCGRTRTEMSASNVPNIRPSKSSWEVVRLCKSAATAGPVVFSKSSSVIRPFRRSYDPSTG